MIREVIATGRDADSAIENGCLELGVPREDVEFEIISLPRKSFFGLKVQPAKVRVYVELPDVVRTPKEPAPRPPKPAEPRSGAPRAEQPRPEQPRPPKAPREERPKPQAQAPQGKPAAWISPSRERGMTL